jgi:hypothetical protein
VSCFSPVALAMGAAIPGWAISQARATLAGVDLYSQRVQHRESAGVQILSDHSTAGLSLHVGFAAILAGEESAGQ